jgi:hypothetical protein
VDGQRTRQHFGSPDRKSLSGRLFDTLEPNPLSGFCCPGRFPDTLFYCTRCIVKFFVGPNGIGGLKPLYGRTGFLDSHDGAGEKLAVGTGFAAGRKAHLK